MSPLVPAGNWSVDSPVIAVNDVLAGSPYAWRIWLYVGMPWSRPRSMSIAPRSTTPLKHCGSVGPSRQSGLPDTGTWNSTLRSWLSIISSLRYCDSDRLVMNGPRPIVLQQVRVEERHVHRDRERQVVAVDDDLDALRPERVQLRGRVSRRLRLGRELAVDLAVRAVPDGRKLVA